ncbi:MAG: cache domain-containing protein, partial [Eubacteriales bacterium]|nr:cache domain-containing protein [Eubacteriales bacterium]
MKHSIRTKLMRTFMLLLCVFLVFSSALTLLSMRFLRNTVLTSAEQLGHLASRSSHEAIVTQALDAAGSFVTEKALTVSQALDDYVNASSEMADYVAYLYEHPDDFVSRPVATPAELVAARLADGPTLQYIPATDRVTGPEASAENALLGNLESVFSIMYQSMPDISSIYTAHESGVNIGYDRNAVLKADTPTLDCRGFAWYTAVKTSQKLYVSPPYEDRFGRGLTVTLAQPIWVNGMFNGVLGVDILIESLNREIQATHYGDGGYAMLLDSAGTVISARTKGDASTLLGSGAQDALLAMRTEDSGFVESQIDQEDVYLLFAPVPAVGWKLTVAVPVADMLKTADEDDLAIQAISTQTLTEMDQISNRVSWMMLGLFIVLVAISVFVVRGICNRLSRPILTLSKDVENISEGNLDYHS